MPNEMTSLKAFEKSPYRSVKWTTYFPVYDALFSKYKGTDVTFVEIGVLDGGSLFMWREFLGPKARIIGVEFNPGAKKWEEHGFEIFIGDQTDKDFWKKFYEEVGPVDVLLDDGGHTFDQQIITVECARDSIRDGGLIVVEDTHSSYQKNFYGPSKLSFIEYAKNIVDGINFRHATLNVKKPSETTIQSTQFFESIVSFHISKTLAGMTCEFVDNGGERADSEDFRIEATRFKRLEDLGKKFSFFSNLPVIGRFLRKPYRFLMRNLYKSQAASIRSGLKQYFKY